MRGDPEPDFRRAAISPDVSAGPMGGPRLNSSAVDPSSTRGIGKYTTLALLLPVSTFIGYLMGYGLDHLFHTGLAALVFLALGTVSGFIELLRELDKDV